MMYTNMNYVFLFSFYKKALYNMDATMVCTVVCCILGKQCTMYSVHSAVIGKNFYCNYWYRCDCVIFLNRNQDFQEVIIEQPGTPGLRFATAYGFRNIQNIVQKVKLGKLNYDFVEVMACPAG